MSFIKSLLEVLQSYQNNYNLSGQDLRQKIQRGKFDFQDCFSLQGIYQLQISSREAEELSRD